MEQMLKKLNTKTFTHIRTSPSNRIETPPETVPLKHLIRPFRHDILRHAPTTKTPTSDHSTSVSSTKMLIL